MNKLSAATKLQNELQEKGFMSIQLCDYLDDGMVTIGHYVLSKEEKPEDNNYPCPFNKWYDLAGEEAVQILEKWMTQIVIFPDQRVL